MKIAYFRILVHQFSMVIINRITFIKAISSIIQKPAIWWTKIIPMLLTWGHLDINTHLCTDKWVIKAIKCIIDNMILMEKWINRHFYLIIIKINRCRNINKLKCSTSKYTNIHLYQPIFILTPFNFLSI